MEVERAMISLHLGLLGQRLYIVEKGYLCPQTQLPYRKSVLGLLGSFARFHRLLTNFFLELYFKNLYSIVNECYDGTQDCDSVFITTSF